MCSREPVYEDGRDALRTGPLVQRADRKAERDRHGQARDEAHGEGEQ